VIGNIELLSRLVLATLLGSVKGFERERMNWAAGLRTHMLVCVGSVLIMLVSAFGFADVQGEKNAVLDPSRIAAQVVSGIGFLGAGSILLRGEIVRGLTTAASLWSVAGIGLAVGGGMYTAALGATIIILIILAGVKPLERRFISVKQQRNITLLVERGSVCSTVCTPPWVREVSGSNSSLSSNRKTTLNSTTCRSGCRARRPANLRRSVHAWQQCRASVNAGTAGESGAGHDAHV
jgi:putative Mg2+ transporter-C (MgtC) family protein